MPLLTRFDPPANWTDLDDAQRQRWSDRVSGWFDREVDNTGGTQGPNRSQFYNPAKEPTDDPFVTDDVTWQGFPKRAERQHGEGTTAAWQSVEEPVTAGGLTFRNQDEYLEWRVERNADGTIRRVIFTCEAPEFWEFLAEADRDKLLALYRQLVGPAVQLGDLIVGGQYDRRNRWNTTDGIVHLTQPNNTLGAEINLAATATILWNRLDGTPVTDETELTECGGFGAPDRASDPHIGRRVNILARQGFSVTLLNPVGLYIDGLDTDGWTKPGPNNTRIPTGQEFWTVTRGTPGLGLRAVYEVPPGVLTPDGTPMTVGDIRIGGVPIRFGGQIAKHVDVKLTGLACRKGQSRRQPEVCPGGGPGPFLAQPAGEASRRVP